MEAKLIQLTDSLWAAIDAARGPEGRAAFIEGVLWRSRAIRDTGYEREARTERGKWERPAKES